MLVGLFQAYQFAKRNFRVWFQDANLGKHLSVLLSKIANIIPLRAWHVSMTII